MKQQRGYILIIVSILLLILSLMVISSINLMQASLSDATVAYTQWKIQAVAQSSASVNAQKHLSAPPVMIYKDSKVILIERRYPLDTISATFNFIGPVRKRNDYSATRRLVEIHTIAFSANNKQQYDNCVASGATEESTQYPKGGLVTYNETQTLSSCLRSQGVYVAHYSQLDIGRIEGKDFNGTPF